MRANSLVGLGSLKPFNVRLPLSLRTTLEASASLANRSLNAHIGLLLEKSMLDHPVITSAPAIIEPLSDSPFGLRLQAGFKSAIQDAARSCGRAMNTEIVIRLLLIAEVGHHEYPVSTSQESHIEIKLQQAWSRLNKAILAMLGSNLSGISGAAEELGAARKEYEHLMQISLLTSSSR